MLRCNERCTSIQANVPTSELRNKNELITKVYIYIYAAQN